MKKETIGWIGTGVMGSSMAKNLSKANYNVIVYNRTKSKAEATGLTVCDNIEDLVKQCNVICTMVGIVKDVEEVYDIILSCDLTYKLIIDFTTTKPELARSINAKCIEKNAMFIDAPVSGGDVGAKLGKLSIMIGGDPIAFDLASEIFKVLGTPIYEGKTGSGQNTKMANQILISGTMLGLCECLVYANKAKLDLNTVINTLGQGAASCWSLTNLAPRMINNNFDPGFFVEHFVKDMEIAIEEAKRMDLNLPSLNLACKLYNELIDDGFGKLGTQSLVYEIEKNNNEAFDLTKSLK